MDFKVMKRLMDELKLQSNNCMSPIEHMWYPIQEVAKSTNNSTQEIMKYLNVLMKVGIIRNVSKNPLIFEFTEKGKKIQDDRMTLEMAEEITKPMQ